MRAKRGNPVKSVGAQAPQLSRRVHISNVLWPGVARQLGPFLCLAKRKAPKRRPPRFAGLRLPAANRLKPGNAESHFAHNFEGSEAQTSALLLTDLSRPAAAAQREEKNFDPRQFRLHGKPPSRRNVPKGLSVGCVGRKRHLKRWISRKKELFRWFKKVICALEEGRNSSSLLVCGT